MEYIITPSINGKCLSCSILCCSFSYHPSEFVLLTKKLLYLFFPSCVSLRVWIHLSIHSPVTFLSMWEENTTFSNILATCTNYSGNRCVITINVCIFPSCLLNSSHPNQHICQAGTCCDVCYKETTLGKSGIHRSCLWDEDNNAVSAVKQCYNKTIMLQVADLQVLVKIYTISITDRVIHTPPTFHSS